MGKITIGQTPWEQISDYVLAATDGTLYSLHPDKNAYIVSVLKDPNPNNFTVNSPDQTGTGSCLSISLPSATDSLFIISNITPINLTTSQYYGFINSMKTTTYPGFYNIQIGTVDSNLDITSQTTGQPTFKLVNRDPLDMFQHKLFPGDSYNLMSTKIKNDTPIYLTAASTGKLYFFKLLRKKDKSTFMEENYSSYKFFTGSSNTIGTTTSDINTILANMEANYQSGKIDMTNLRKYCCQGQNFKLQECNSAYIDNKQIIGKLYYITYNYTVNITNGGNITIPDTSKAIITNGYITPMVNTQIMFKANNVDNNGIAVIKGFITFPRTDVYSFKSSHDDGLVLTIGAITIFNNPNYGTDVTSVSQSFNAGSNVISINLINTAGPGSMNLQYKDSTMSDFADIPAEWFSAPYYYNLIGNYNSYLNTACGTSTNWYSSTCYPLINNNPSLIGNVADNVVNYCKIGGAGAIANSAACTTLYNSSTPNEKIMKSYCLENNRYMTDDKCNDYIMMNALKGAPATDPIKTSILNYCGQTPSSGSVSNWSTPKCQNYISNIYENDQVFWDQYCIANGNLIADYQTCKPNYINSSNQLISGRNTTDFEKKIFDNCNLNNKWQTDTTCKTLLSDSGNSTALGSLASNIISTCKVGGSSPAQANCAVLYTNNSPDRTIQKSYCTNIVNGVPRFINDPTCTTWATNNQNDSTYQTQFVNYCGDNKTNWDSANCTNLRNSANSAAVPTGSDKLDHQVYDKYCITNKNLTTDARCSTYYGADDTTSGKEYNTALTNTCKDIWKTDLNCATAINNDSSVLTDLSTNIINACKLGASNPLPAGCANVYLNNSNNNAIKKSYCTDINSNGVPRFIDDPTCTTWANNNQNDLTYQEYVKNYCTYNKDTWNNTNCKTFLSKASSATVPSGSDPLDKQLYDKYCITNMNALNDYNICKTRYGENTATTDGKKFTDAIIDKCIKTNGAIDNTKLFSTTSCISDPSVTTQPSYLTSGIYEGKVNYCNNATTFTNTNCKVFIPDGNNVGRFDTLLKNNCVTGTNTTQEPCLTISNATYANSIAIPQFNKTLNDSCIDTNGKFINSDSCVARNVSTNPYYYNLMEPTLKYCGDKDASGANNITNKFCTDYMNNNFTKSTDTAGCPIKSTFVGSPYEETEDTSNCCWYNSILFFILMLVIVMLIYKHSEKATGLPLLMIFNRKCKS